MSSLAHQLKITEQEYLEGELLSEIKHEYIDGEVFAMVGATSNHILLSSSLNALFYMHLKGKPCNTYASDMKVKVDTKYFYPDVLVDCSNLAAKDCFTENPTLIVEVLSGSTQKYDKIRTKS